MTARDYMSTIVQTVSPRNTLKDVAQLLFEHDCGMVPVVEKGEVKGVLTDRDVAIIACNHDRPLSDLNVADVLKKQVYSCGPDASLAEVLEIMSSKHVRRLTVLEDGALAGVVSLDDLTRAVGAGKIKAQAFVDTVAAVAKVTQTA